MIAILLAPVYLLANYYLLRRVMGWVKAWFPFFRTARHWALPVAVQAFLACSIVIAFFLPEGRARRVMKLIGNYWLGVLLYVLLAVIAADLLRLLLGYVLPFKHIFVTTQMHRIAGCVCALVILIASIWGVVNARIIHVTPYDVTVDKTVEGMDEMKVVLVADLHLGYNIGEKQMQQMVDRINEQDADLVVIAGDIFDNEWEAVEDPETIAATLRSIRSSCDTSILFGAYDDGWPKHFAFWEEDCFDPPKYLICAKSFEDAYDIFLDEFASIPDDDDVERLVDDLLVELVERCVKGGSIAKFDEITKEWLAALKIEKPEEYAAFREKAMQDLGNDGQVTWAPNGARHHEPDRKWGCLRWAEGINGRELKLVKIELVEER